MTIFRIIFGLPMAALITLGLFVFMANMIKSEAPVATPKPTPEINILAKIIETPIAPSQPQKPNPLPNPPDPVTPDYEGKKTNPGNNGWGAKPGPIEKGPLEFESIGPVTPDIRVAPQYPNTCQSRGAEGVVLVQFDVTPDGDVINVQILESANSCFNSTVVRAVSRWKYAPGRRNGKPVARRGVIEKFVFTLQD
ncbi:MAG: TonB family protein [Pseudomonadota bacterium]